MTEFTRMTVGYTGGHTSLMVRNSIDVLKRLLSDDEFKAKYASEVEVLQDLLNSLKYEIIYAESVSDMTRVAFHLTPDEVAEMARLFRGIVKNKNAEVLSYLKNQEAGKVLLVKMREIWGNAVGGDLQPPIPPYVYGLYRKMPKWDDREEENMTTIVPTSKGADYTFTYVRTFDDWLAYNIDCQSNFPINQRQRRKPLWYKLLYGFAVLFCVFFIVFGVLGGGHWSDHLFWGVLAVLAFLFGFTDTHRYITRPLTRMTLKNMQADYSDYLVEWRLTFSEQGIDSRADGFHMTIDWRRYKAAKVTKDYIFIYIYRQWGETLPTRLFESEAKRKEFIEYLKTKIPHVKHEEK